MMKRYQNKEQMEITQINVMRIDITQVSDIVIRILENIEDGTTYKSARLVCRVWFAAAGDRVDEFSNHLWTLINMFPNKDWNWDELSRNARINWNIIKNSNEDTKFYWIWHRFYNYLYDKINPKWNWDIIAAHNPHITWGILYDSRILWYNENTIRNDNIPLYLLEKYYLPLLDITHKKPWSYATCHLFTSRRDLTLDFIIRHPSENWNWGLISCHKNITCEIIEATFSSGEIRIPWSWYDMASNSNITWKFVKKYINKEWNWHTLCCHVNITWDDILAFPPLEQHWNAISYNPNITVDIIEQNLDRNWNWHRLSRNKNIPFSYVKTHRDRNWDCDALSERISWEEIKNFPSVDWNWNIITMRKDITWEMIKPYLRWIRDNCISHNHNLTWRIIRDNPNINWNWDILSQNSFKSEFNQ